MTTKAGTLKTKAFLKEAKPRNIWIATPCTPGSKLQNINQRSDKQREELSEKREISKKIIRNCISVANLQISLGGHVHWEWPRGATSWQLDMIQKFIARHNLPAAFLDGCQVKMQDSEANLIFKPWTIRTSFQLMHKALSLRCSKDYSHRPIEGSVTAGTAF